MDPLVYKQLSMLLRPQAPILRTANLTAADPPIGSTVFTPMANDPDKHRSNNKRIIVWLGNCQTCMNSDISPWLMEANKRRVQLDIASSAKAPDTVRFLKERGWRGYGNILQLQPESATRLNLAFFPRVYLADAKGRLLWVQKEMASMSYSPFNDAKFLQEIETR